MVLCAVRKPSLPVLMPLLVYDPLLGLFRVMPSPVLKLLECWRVVVMRRMCSLSGAAAILIVVHIP